MRGNRGPAGGVPGCPQRASSAMRASAPAHGPPLPQRGPQCQHGQNLNKGQQCRGCRMGTGQKGRQDRHALSGCEVRSLLALRLGAGLAAGAPGHPRGTTTGSIQHRRVIAGPPCFSWWIHVFLFKHTSHSWQKGTRSIHLTPARIREGWQRRKDVQAVLIPTTASTCVKGLAEKKEGPASSTHTRRDEYNLQLYSFRHGCGRKRKDK